MTRLDSVFPSRLDIPHSSSVHRAPSGVTGVGRGANAGADPGGDWGDRPPKSYESNFIHHDFINSEKNIAINPFSPAPSKILAQVCNVVTRNPIELESYPNHPRIQQVFCLKSKKNDFRFRFRVRWGDRCKRGCFCFFLATFTWPWTTTHSAITFFRNSRFFWKLGQNPHL